MFGLASHWSAAKYKLESVVEEDISSKLPKGKYSTMLWEKLSLKYAIIYFFYSISVNKKYI